MDERQRAAAGGSEASRGAAAATAAMPSLIHWRSLPTTPAGGSWAHSLLQANTAAAQMRLNSPLPSQLRPPFPGSPPLHFHLAYTGESWAHSLLRANDAAEVQMRLDEEAAADDAAMSEHESDDAEGDHIEGVHNQNGAAGGGGGGGDAAAGGWGLALSGGESSGDDS